MVLILLEALLALIVLVAIVWWTMFSGRKGGELPQANDTPSKDHYSDKSWLWIVVRGLLIAALGAVATTVLDLPRISWVVVIGVSALLTLVNLRTWYQDKQRR